MRHCEKALEKVMPSVDPMVFDNYEKMSRDIVKRRGSWDNIPFYG